MDVKQFFAYFSDFFSAFSRQIASASGVSQSNSSCAGTSVSRSRSGCFRMT
jgi:hypothetical protein